VWLVALQAATAGRSAPPRPKTIAAVRQVEMAKILVVDDYADTAESLALWLELIGHEVEIAHDGHRAMEVACRQRPDYMLLDLGLPGLNGY
jgi:CheY-like chemotaxis protein